MCACVAFGCANKHSKKIPGLTYHRFPSDLKLRKAWINAIKRKDWKPSPHSRLCSEHFTKDQIIRISPSTVRLKKDSIPCVFNFPFNLQKILEEKKQIESTYENENIGSPEENNINENLQSTVEEMSNDDENFEPDDDNSNQSNEIKINEVFSIRTCERSPTILKPHTEELYLPRCILGTSESKAVMLPANGDTCSNSNFVKVQYISPMLNELSNSFSVKQVVNTCDASTSTEGSGSKENELRQQLANSNLLLNRYRKKIKTLQQQNRRYKDRLRNVKHSIFAELLKRRYLSSDSYFKTGQPDCLLDRQSIRPCLSSENEKSDQDE